jgi:PhzF family phenazine biosynthesis protein
LLWEAGAVERGDAITFHTKSAQLVAHVEGESIHLDFPCLPVEPCEIPPGLDSALGAAINAAYRNGNDIGLVELESEQAIRELAPDFTKLRSTQFAECIVTARSATGQCDFVSRFFAPGAGIDEDPVTGSAHCSLAPYWAERLDKREMIGHQLSKRGGEVRVRLRDDRVDLIGQAVTVLRGELTEHTARD